jgi:hypothetical protein
MQKDKQHTSSTCDRTTTSQADIKRVADPGSVDGQLN